MPQIPPVLKKSFVAPSILVEKVYRRLLAYWHHYFCHKNFIFKHSGPYSAEKRKDCIFACYSSYNDVPENVRDDMCINDNKSRQLMDQKELEDHALLWIAFVEKRVASIVFTRKGAFFKRWFVDLKPEDLVVFRLSTHPNYRGNGLAGSLIRHAMHKTAHKEGCTYIDCRTYNKPSIRCIEKTGFKCIAVKKTIKREWALYD